MKKLFVTLAFICASLSTWAQFTYHNAVPQWYDLLRVDKLLWINTSDTTGYPAVMYKGAVVFRQQPGDTAHYFSNGLRWLKIGSGAVDLSGYYTKTESDARYPLLSGSYSNPSWISSLSWSKITGTPSLVNSLNGLSGALSLAAGTGGTDFNISAAGTTITLNIPSASATARGMVSTAAQTFAGTKTFSNNIVLNNVPAMGSAANRYMVLNGDIVNSRTPIQVLSDIGGAPASASANYIQNTTTQQSSSNFSISGNGLVGNGIAIGSTTPDLSNSKLYVNSSWGQIIRNPGSPALAGGGRLKLLQAGIPTAPNYPLGVIEFSADGNTSGVGIVNMKYAAQIAAQSDGAWTDLSSYPTRLSFFTNPGGTNVSETMRLTSAGWLSVGSGILSNYGLAAPLVVSYDGAQFDVSPTLTSNIVTFNSRNSSTGALVPMVFNAGATRFNPGAGTAGVGINKDPGAGFALDVNGRTNSGGLSMSARTITASTTTTTTDYTIISQATTGNPTITLTGGSGTIYVLVEEAANPTSNGMNWTPAITYKGATYSNANNAALSAFSRFTIQNVAGTWYLIGAD